MTLTLTNHARYDRMERLTKIIDYVGIDEIIIETRQHNGTGMARYGLTRSGVVLVRSDDGKQLITGFLANIDRATAMFCSLGYPSVPKNIAKVIVKNMTMYADLIEQKKIKKIFKNLLTNQSKYDII